MKFERLLFLHQSTLSASAEWEISTNGWRLARLSQGQAYWLGGEAAREWREGEVLVLPPGARGSVRASRISEVLLHYFDFSPDSLSGLLTLAEREYFESLGKRRECPPRILPSHHPSSMVFSDVVAYGANNTGSLLLRCQMLHLTAAVFSEEINRHHSSLSTATTVDERFKQLISEMADKEIVEQSPEELARTCGCSLRHFSRLFRHSFEVSLRERKKELRLLKAWQMLTETDSRVMTVAGACGYPHLGVFNALFKKRFGVTPTECRRQNASNGTASAAPRGPGRKGEPTEPPVVTET